MRLIIKRRAALYLFQKGVLDSLNLHIVAVPPLMASNDYDLVLNSCFFKN